jgi:arsenate reductase
MAEGWTRHLKGDLIEVFSAGIEVHGLNPHAVAVMKESDVDISHHVSKHVKEVENIPFDFIITVCDHAKEHCPLFLGSGKMIHVGFEDPPALAKELALKGYGKDLQLDSYRKVRDEIKEFVLTLPESLENL